MRIDAAASVAVGGGGGGADRRLLPLPAFVLPPEISDLCQFLADKLIQQRGILEPSAVIFDKIAQDRDACLLIGFRADEDRTAVDGGHLGGHAASLALFPAPA